jgi:hypothetical protein
MKAILSLISMFCMSVAAYAQDTNPPAPAASPGEPVSMLMFFTLGAVLLIAIGAFAWFLRSRSNRDAADRAMNPDNPANR